MNAQRQMAWLAAAVFAAVLAGCSGDPTEGYSFDSLYRTDIKSVAVPMWDVGQDVYRRELQTRLSEALVKRIEMDTPYKVTTAARADTELRGKIDVVSQRVLSYVPSSGEPREIEMTFIMSFTWKDLRTGKIIAEKQKLEVSDTYITQSPLESDFFQGSEKVINECARRVVEQLEAPW
jgi:hypothetical protein